MIVQSCNSAPLCSSAPTSAGSSAAHSEPSSLKKRKKEKKKAARRDHRKLGQELALFSISETAGPGLVFWHPKGAMVSQCSAAADSLLACCALCHLPAKVLLQ